MIDNHNDDRNAWGYVAVIITILLGVFLVTELCNAQVTFTSKGRSPFYVIAAGDTLDTHYELHKALETLANHNGPGEIHRTLVIAKEGSITETVYLYQEPAQVRNITHTIIEDSLPGFKLLIAGYTGADQVRYASKCIGYDSTLTAIDERLGLTLAPDSTGFITGTTARYDCYHKGEGMNALLTYWLTAIQGTEETTVARFIDVAHVLNLN